MPRSWASVVLATTQPLLIPPTTLSTGQREHVVGELGLRRPDLLAVDDPLVAVAHGRGLERRQVRAGVRLAEALAPLHLAPQDLGQELLLLLLGPPLQDRRADEGVTEE